MRYQYFASDDGRWFIVDTQLDTIFAYIGNELLAKKVCRMLNQSDEPLTLH